MKYTIVAEKEWVDGGKGSYPGRVVLLKIDKGGRTEYSTHVQIDGTKDKVGTLKDGKYLYIAWGHYFQDILSAAQDFNERTPGGG